MNFERIRYPDGQISTKFTGYSSDMDYTIKQRINSYEDLDFLRACADIIHNGEAISEDWNLFIPHMFADRSDRRFDDNQSFDLKRITNTINDCHFKRVTILDPHSDVTMALLDRVRKITSYEYVTKAIEDTSTTITDSGIVPDIVLVSPDAGAYKKVFDYGEKLNLPVMAAVKYRDKEGKISMVFTQEVKGLDCFIVDDLCDGGRTFNILAGLLKEKGARTVQLYITHGLFSQGFYELYNSVDHIYCTNSIKDIKGGPIFPPKTSEEMHRDSIGNIEDFLTQFIVI